MKTDLLPCPFCGEDAHFVHYESYDNDDWSVECVNADCELEPSTRCYFTKEQAIEAWNTRSEREAATLGGGRLTAEQVREAWTGNLKRDCLYDPPMPDWQAIADELSAALDCGECEMEYGGDVTEDTARVMDVYFCSECGSPNYNDCMPHYCIYCGKAVKR